MGINGTENRVKGALIVQMSPPSRPPLREFYGQLRVQGSNRSNPALIISARKAISSADGLAEEFRAYCERNFGLKSETCSRKIFWQPAFFRAVSWRYQILILG